MLTRCKNDNFGIFVCDELNENVIRWLRQWLTTRSSEWHNCSISVSIIKMPWRNFIEFSIDADIFAIRILILSVKMSRDVSISNLAATLIFTCQLSVFSVRIALPVVGHCCNCPRTFQADYGQQDHGQQPDICHCSFSADCHSCRDISIYCFVAILLLPVVYQCCLKFQTLSEHAIVENCFCN